MKKQIVAIPLAIVGWPVVVQMSVLFHRLQMFIAGLFFETEGWKSDDKLMWTLGAAVCSLFIWVCVMAWFENKESK